ncbi:hypothetical protein SAMN04487830_13118 [Pseudobutyrivibrio sp. OR37]|uniref:hypothetical protein n=1 Tax=Pseudobutyrivibrio sp. OR37 TaxID=1798186 RepID=UPI0008EAFCC1|nr:hypothetical protein [Pseudobutyrivibrio sp. OR37]SFI21704.1 hypothetical protein SAMN04487830_13118 [Pseudobutyrivibrio sp. OR37]
MNKKRIIALGFVMAALIIAFTAFTLINKKDVNKGSALTLEGNTIVVSIFASDTNTNWNDKEDVAKKSTIYTYLDIACNYLEDAASKYDKKATFISNKKDLEYSITFDKSITCSEVVDNGELDETVWEFIASNIDESTLKQKYDATNVVYMLYVDSDESNTAISCTRDYYDGMPYDSEIVYLYNIDGGTVNCPAVYAHEILHTFGAPDLYTTDDELGITQEVLDYANKNMSNDIMLTCSDLSTDEYNYQEITNEVDDITAYYVGLTSKCEVLNQ